MNARVCLRRLTEQDATKEYARWFQDKELRRWIARATPTIAACRAYIAEQRKNPDVMLWGIFVQGHHVGNIKCEREHDRAVLGLLIGEREVRGMGIGPAAIRQAAQWCFRHWKVGVVAAGVHPFNTRSMRAFKKCNFKVDDLAPRVWLHLEKR
mgnify:FL=1